MNTEVRFSINIQSKCGREKEKNTKERKKYRNKWRKDGGDGVVTLEKEKFNLHKYLKQARNNYRGTEIHGSHLFGYLAYYLLYFI